MMADDKSSEFVCEAFCEASCLVEYVVGLFCECFLVFVFCVFYAFVCGYPELVCVFIGISFDFPVLVFSVDFVDCLLDFGVCHFVFLGS